MCNYKNLNAYYIVSIEITSKCIIDYFQKYVKVCLFFTRVLDDLPLRKDPQDGELQRANCGQRYFLAMFAS